MNLAFFAGAGWLAFSLASASASALAAEPAVVERAPPQVWVEPISGIAFVHLPKACYTMGRHDDLAAPADSEWDNIGYRRPLNLDERPAHEVCVDAFWMARHEVTDAQWTRVMGAAGEPSRPGRFAVRAKGGVSFGAAQDFARRLSELAGGTLRFRLPSEAEWEYACRAGGKDTGLSREELATQAWFQVADIDQAKPKEVGLLDANAFGLHDMLGNVWEWTRDSYQADAYTRHALFNPLLDLAGAGGPRVIRGGSVRTEFPLMRCARRGRQSPDQPLALIGFRLVREQ